MRDSIVALCLIAVLSACSKPDDRADVSGPMGGATASAATRDGGAAAEATALAEAEAELRGLAVQVLQLRRVSAGSLKVRFAFIKRTDPPGRFELGNRFAVDPADLGSIADVYLVDRVRQKKYYVLRDAQGRPMCSADQRPLEPGERRELWATFAAPSAETAGITVSVPHVPAIEDVQVPRDLEPEGE